MTLRMPLLLAACLASPLALADACQVETHPVSRQVPGVETETCYEYSGMPAGAVDWSCSNESKDMLQSDKRKVANCKSGWFGRCTGALTQEALANPQSSGEEGSDPANIPADAKVVTYHYTAKDPAQAKIDCESGGGTWQAP
ncbi:hypothetical protein PSm6_48340 [Pseudomonas solani]|uniref:Lipoprotein n=1 Tax=Pseudomonas solani TaxID=2731552 RepID=A0ABM7LFP9_9PSED|nr:hypothetical protein [Pseudomonas solani]EQM67981.1 hypothetical protein L682_20195 [Pseudomonas alcaligenes OT 69]MDN4149383.1 hypothetical protein [Pseudomonas tohonis]BCD88427.1 hypothetical protein PSm6_48340 [Pseudomonas solani]